MKKLAIIGTAMVLSSAAQAQVYTLDLSGRDGLLGYTLMPGLVGVAQGQALLSGQTAIRRGQYYSAVAAQGQKARKDTDYFVHIASDPAHRSGGQFDFSVAGHPGYQFYMELSSIPRKETPRKLQYNAGLVLGAKTDIIKPSRETDGVDRWCYVYRNSADYGAAALAPGYIPQEARFSACNRAPCPFGDPNQHYPDGSIIMPNDLAITNIRYADQGDTMPIPRDIPECGQLVRGKTGVATFNFAPDFTISKPAEVTSVAGKAVEFPRWVTEAHDGDGGTHLPGERTKYVDQLKFVTTANSNTGMFTEQPKVSWPSHTLRYTTHAQANGNAHVCMKVVDKGGNGLSSPQRCYWIHIDPAPPKPAEEIASTGSPDSTEGATSGYSQNNTNGAAANGQTTVAGDTSARAEPARSGKLHTGGGGSTAFFLGLLSLLRIVKRKG
jgi:hypothetical protein